MQVCVGVPVRRRTSALIIIVSPSSTFSAIIRTSAATSASVTIPVPTSISLIISVPASATVSPPIISVPVVVSIPGT
ncbi:hypothetical protein Hanom_Chr05g00424951 [Helianthus anomalus]